MAFTKVRNSMLVQPVNHNILINPSFTVNQRGDVIDHDGDSYGSDRWYVRGKDDVKSTLSRTSTDYSSGTNKLVVETPDATEYSYVAQQVEAVNVQGLYGNEMTFSFSYSDTGGSGIPKVGIYSWGSTTTYKTLFEAIPTSLGNNRWSCTFTLSTPDGTVPIPNVKGLQLTIFPNEQNAAPAEWSVWETKLEVGSVATPFITRSYGDELALCQRYYCSTHVNLPIGSISAVGCIDKRFGQGNGNEFLTYVYPVSMRISNPAVVVYSPITGVSARIAAESTGDVEVDLLSVSSSSAVAFTKLSPATPLYNQRIRAHFSVDAEL